jgi:restriction system protein
LASREARAAYLENRQSEVDQLNEELDARVTELRSILAAAPEYAEPIKFSKMKKVYRPIVFNPEASVGPSPRAPGRGDFVTHIEPPGFFSRLFGGNAKYEAAKSAAEVRDKQAFAAALAKYESLQQEWSDREAAARRLFDTTEATRKTEIESHNATIDSFADAYRLGRPDAVVEYFGHVLDRSVLPDEFPEEYRLAYVPESKQVVVEHWLPTVQVVPDVSEYTYVKTKDEVREKARKKGEVKALYETAIAQTCLRILNEIFSSDEAEVVQSAVLNGVVDAISPSTGEHIRPCIVSVRSTREEFCRLVVERIDPVSCLRSLGAVSKKAEELTPVRPVIEFDMVDRRFVAEADIISNLDSRPNVIDFTPSEFESLVTNLFTGMGLETKQTRSSRDGGVDAVAYDSRPVLGGKVVIQAKRYKNTVGVAAVRDLYGTMINEGANKGILVTTAGYGPDAFAFAKDKPIELLDGAGLLYLLSEQGIEAKIVMPES